jgi:hypothetical protein
MSTEPHPGVSIGIVTITGKQAEGSSVVLTCEFADNKETFTRTLAASELTDKIRVGQSFDDYLRPAR